MSELTAKQRAFIQEYCVDKNATQAAIRAGYSKKTARQIGDQNLSKLYIKREIDELLARLADNTETEAEWVRRRLKAEAEDCSVLASHSARIRALEILAKMNGMFEIDNRQKTDPLRDLLGALSGNVLGVSVINGSENEESR